ncbi:MAG TPA: alkaline phosphatase family protein [bacterium]|nr:alkaline phosphatase family protein [bacterium]
MRKHVRAGIASALLGTSAFALGAMILNLRFVDDPRLGAFVFLVVPIVAGAVLGPVLGYWLDRLARVGSSEDPVRATELLWATVTAGLLFATTFVFLPSFLGIFESSEFVRYTGALLVAGGFAWMGARIARAAAHRFLPLLYPALLALPALVVLAPQTPWGAPGPGSRVLVLAFPGLSWNVAEDLIERGEMPNLAELRRTGAWGDLHSNKGMSSAVWTSIATGKPQESHGATGVNPLSNEVQSSRVWDILGDRGWKVGLFGWPVTWPPPEVDGFVVPSISDPGWDTHPRDLQFIRDLAIREKTGQARSWGIYCRFAFLGIQYGAHLSTLLEGGRNLAMAPFSGRELNASQLFSRRKLRARLNCDYFAEIRRRSPVDFAAFHSNIVHVAQAYFWKYHEPERFAEISDADIERYGDSVQDAYRMVDEFIGRVLEDSSRDDLVVVVSDHGAEALVEPGQRMTLRIEPMLTNLRLRGAVEATNVAARTYLRMKPGHDGTEDRVCRLFQTARLASADFKPFSARLDEWGNVEVRVNPRTASAPQDFVLFQGGRCLVRELVREVELSESAQVLETGAIVLNGRGVLPEEHFDDCGLLDIVPTLLVLTGMDLAADMPGDVLHSALDPRFRDAVPGMVATYDAPPAAPLN